MRRIPPLDDEELVNLIWAVDTQIVLIDKTRHKVSQPAVQDELRTSLVGVRQKLDAATDASEYPRHRRIYGRGYRDGWTASSEENGGRLDVSTKALVENIALLETVHRSLFSIARALRFSTIAYDPPEKGEAPGQFSVLTPTTIGVTMMPIDLFLNPSRGS